MSLLHILIPRPVRIVRHPVGYVKRRATPRPVRHALHPVSTAEARAVIRPPAKTSREALGIRQKVAAGVPGRPPTTSPSPVGHDLQVEAVLWNVEQACDELSNRRLGFTQPLNLGESGRDVGS